MPLICLKVSCHSIKVSARFYTDNENYGETETKPQDLKEMLKGMINTYSTDKIVVNPEINQKIQAADAAAVNKYLQ